MAEWGLLVLLTLHLVLGLRLVILELGSWQGLRLSWVKWAWALAMLIGLAFVAVLAA